jgi:thiol-disulfide isomerase/thioredoxin
MKKLLILLLIAAMNSGYSEEQNNLIYLSENEALKLPLPLPYERKEVTAEELKKFIQNTKDKQAVVIFGANWCPDCRILAGTLKLPSVDKFIRENYSILHVDLGKYDINMSLLEVLGIPKPEGVPRVVIFDKEGKALNLDTHDRWRTARDSKQQEIFNYFQKYVLIPH